MKVRVRMFGVLAERAGRGEEVLDLPSGATGADVLREIRRRHPDGADVLPRVSIAVNLEVAPPETRLREQDEVALLPPVAGGAGISVGLRERPSVAEALEAVASPEAGGTCVFLGTVRGTSDQGPVDRLDYSAYAEMADGMMRHIAQEAVEKWDLAAAAILHAVGSLDVGELTMVVACSAPHRADAFEACRYVVDEVKRRLPVWKKERGPWGERWVGW